MSAVMDFDRNSGIGASDAAPACGLSKWQTPLQLYREKLKLADDRELEPKRLPLMMGKALEPLVLDLFTRKTGIACESARQLRVHDPKAPWRWVSLDAMADDGQPVEAKSAAVAYAHEWGDEKEDDAVPMQYYMQAQHALGCSEDWEYIWMPLLVLNRQFRLYRVRRDNEVIHNCRIVEEQFMQCLRTQTPPPPVDLEDLNFLFPTDTVAQLVATAELSSLIGELKVAKVHRKAADEREEELTLEVKKALGVHGTVTDPVGKVLATWKQAKSSQKFDKDKFRIAHPGLYREFEIEVPGSRRLLIK